MKYYYKLNLALKFLSKNNIGYLQPVTLYIEEYNTLPRIYDYLVSNGIKENEIPLLLKQLELDKYVILKYNEYDPQRVATPDYISITYNGIRFIDELGGYKTLSTPWYTTYKDVLLLSSGVLLSAVCSIAVSYLEKDPKPPHINIETYKCDSLNVYKKN